MPVVVPVKFAFAARELWFDPRGLDILEGDHAICTTERGTEIGLVTADPFEVEPEELAAPLKPVVRIATDATSTAPTTLPTPARTPCSTSVAWWRKTVST